ncbi:MAG: aquaporin family protein [Gammaproteobacteria bacterium]|nr:aquaporin family protein [Gammaproteobacteria bacterium]
MSLRQCLLAEALGTAFLLAVVVGSGIMGQRLAGGNEALVLLVNSTATGAGLLALVAALAPVSGAHFNPLVSLMMSVRGDLPWKALPGYVMAQCVGAVVGVFAAHAMFALPILELATKPRPGWHLAWSELVASFGLLLVVHHTSAKRPDAVPAAVGCYIAAAYWFTSSTSFANPAVALARALTDTFTGISPANLPAFIAAELAGALLFLLYLRRTAARTTGGSTRASAEGF